MKLIKLNGTKEKEFYYYRAEREDYEELIKYVKNDPEKSFKKVFIYNCKNLKRKTKKRFQDGIIFKNLEKKNLIYKQYELR